MTAAILALPGTPEWLEVDKRHVLAGLAPYRDSFLWAYFDVDSDVCLTVWDGADTRQDRLWHAILMGQVETGWRVVCLAAARRMQLLKPGQQIGSQKDRSLPVLPTPLERFLWTTLEMVDMGPVSSDPRSGRVVALDPAVVVTNLTR